MVRGVLVNRLVVVGSGWCVEAQMGCRGGGRTSTSAGGGRRTVMIRLAGLLMMMVLGVGVKGMRLLELLVDIAGLCLDLALTLR